MLADLTFDSQALAEVVIDNPEEVVENQIILEPMDIGSSVNKYCLTTLTHIIVSLDSPTSDVNNLLL